MEIVYLGNSMIEVDSFLILLLNLISILLPLLGKVLVDSQNFIGHTLEQLIESSSVVHKYIFLPEIIDCELFHNIVEC